MEVAFLGIDLAKNIFQLHGEDADGRVVLQRRVRRDRLMLEIEGLPLCVIAIEACSGAFYWQRRFEAVGHRVRIIAPQYVKPFAQHQKNDRNDAAAICCAVRQPNMKFVPGKSLEQQDIQALHRGRQRLVNHRTALVSQMRGLLLDRGIAFAQSITRARREIRELLEDCPSKLSDLFRSILLQLYDCLLALDRQIAWFDKEIDKVFRSNDACRRLARIRGVGPKTATAVVAAVGDGSEFINGRYLAAWMGLVPRQHSSGNRQRLFGISKRGDRHLRTLLIHGARAVVRTSASRDDAQSAWIRNLRARRGAAKTIVAVANKNARVIFAMLKKGTEFRVA
ncbi:MAG: IS110 family transposase [Variibacter sp.]